MHVERHLNKKCRLRYVLVSEYGKNTHRAHYHMLLWNMPFVSDAGRNSWSALKDFIEKAWSFGWIGIERCLDCSGKYCMKYLRKECVVPKDCNPTFLLSSRRGGIGRAYADSLKEYAQTNPDMASIQILNKFDGSVTRCAVPAYFKRLWFPSLSSIVSKEVRDCVSSCMELARTVSYALSKFYASNLVDPSWELNPVLDMANDIEDRFPYCVENWIDITPERIHRREVDSWLEQHNMSVMLSVSEPQYRKFLESDFFLSLMNNLDERYKELCAFNVDRERVQHLIDLHTLHSSLMLGLAQKAEPVCVEDEVARLARQNDRLERGVRPID